MIRTTVNAVDEFGLVTAKVDRLLERALNEAVEEGAAVARSAGAERGLTDVQVIPARGTVDGWAAGIRGRWYYRFQAQGTLASAINPKRPGTKRDHSKPGIKPNRMFTQARTAARKRLLQRLRHGI